MSIIVPVRDEAALVAGSVTRLARDFPGCELIVVDGSSTDETADLTPPAAQLIRSAPGRATQQNAGARAAGGDVLWFVHVDTRLDPAALGQLRAALWDPGVVGGGLTLRFDERGPGLDYLAWSSNQRARRLGWVFGDQAMFVRADVFAELGGFPDLALMEDLELSRRLRRRGRLAVLPATSTAAARRLTAHGVWRMTVFMQYLKVLYLLGADPAGIRRRYEAGPPRPDLARLRRTAGRRIAVLRGR